MWNRVVLPQRSLANKRRNVFPPLRKSAETPIANNMKKVFDIVSDLGSASANIVSGAAGSVGGAVTAAGGTVVDAACGAAGAVGGAVAAVGGTVVGTARGAAGAVGGAVASAVSAGVPVIFDFAKELRKLGFDGCTTVADITGELAKRGISVCNTAVDAAVEAAKFGWDIATSPPAIEGYKFLGYVTLAGVGVYALYVVATAAIAAVLAALPYFALCAIGWVLLMGSNTPNPDYVVYKVK